MKDEIKEILDNIQDVLNEDNGVYDVEIEKEILKSLLDYITNLQKEVRINNDLIPYLKNKEKSLKKQITNLQEENKRYKRIFEGKERFSKIMPDDTDFIILSKADYDRQQEDIELGLIDYKSRNEKAIESLTKNKYYIDLAEVLNILKGDDKDEKTME